MGAGVGGADVLEQENVAGAVEVGALMVVAEVEADSVISGENVAVEWAAEGLAGLEYDGQGLDRALKLLRLLPKRTRSELEDWSSPRTDGTEMTLSHTMTVKNQD